MKAALIIVTGFVQGVGYRQFVKQQARKLGLTGWVLNLPNGDVEVNAIGPKEEVDKLIEICRKGTHLSQVASIDVSWGEEEAGEEFIVM